MFLLAASFAFGDVVNNTFALPKSVNDQLLSAGWINGFFGLTNNLPPHLGFIWRINHNRIA